MYTFVAAFFVSLTAVSVFRTALSFPILNSYNEKESFSFSDETSVFPKYGDKLFRSGDNFRRVGGEFCRSGDGF